jgi:hypothetical protein
MPYDFFFSYTRANNDHYLQKFFKNLNEEVRSKAGYPKDTLAGYFDQQRLELGTDWSPALVAALQESSTLVSVYSPAYFTSEFCGREWGFFDDRRKLYLEKQRNAGFPLVPSPAVVKPVLWVPIHDALPPGVDGNQFTEGDPHAAQNTVGLRMMRMQYPKFKHQYLDFVDRLADEILAAKAKYQASLPVLTGATDFHSVRNAFQKAPAPALGAAAPKRQEQGPNADKFVGPWIGFEKSNEHLAALALQSSEAQIEAPPKVQRPRRPGNAEPSGNPETTIHAQLTAETAPGQTLVQVKNTGERAIFTATARIMRVIEQPPTGNNPFLHSYPLRWTVNNRNDIQLENGALAQLLIASTNQIPTRPSEARLYELILESYQGGTPLRPGEFRWNGEEPNDAVKVYLEVTVSSVGHGAVAQHFVVTSVRWGGIKIERVAKDPNSTGKGTGTTSLTGAFQSGQVQSVDFELRDRLEAARERYIAFILMVPASDDMEAIRHFGEDIRFASDLFGESIFNYLDTIYKSALDLHRIRQQKETAFDRGLPEDEIARLASTENTLVSWFTAQYGELRERLAPFLTLANHVPVPAAAAAAPRALSISQQQPQPPPNLIVDKRMENDVLFLAVENTGGEIAVHGLIAAVVGMEKQEEWPDGQILAKWEPGESHVKLRRGIVRRLAVARRRLQREGYRWFVSYIKPDGNVTEAPTTAYPVGNLSMVEPGNPAEIRIWIVADSPNSETLYSRTFFLSGDKISER